MIEINEKALFEVSGGVNETLSDEDKEPKPPYPHELLHVVQQ